MMLSNHTLLGALKGWFLKFMFSKDATKIGEIFTVDLILCGKRQIDGIDFVNFRSLPRKYELYFLELVMANFLFSIRFFYSVQSVSKLSRLETDFVGQIQFI